MREYIIDQLAAASVDVDRAAARMTAAEALADAVSLPGLRYEAADAAHSVYVVACDGRPIGFLWPGPDGRQLGGWTCAEQPDGERLGPYRTARAAAAALASAVGVSPTHTLPAE